MRARWWVTGVLLAAVLGLTAALASGFGVDPSTQRTALAGSTAPDLQGTTITGARADLAALRGHVVLVNVWAPWCAPCRDELPLLADTAQRWQPDGLRVLGVATRTTPEAARALLRTLHAERITSINDPKGTLAVSWGASGVPETFVVDRDGVVRARRVGPLTAQWLAENVQPLLAAS